MNILISESDDYNPKALEVYRRLGNVTARNCNRETLIKLIPDVNILVIRLGILIDKEILNTAKNLQVIISPTTGLNHIDVLTAKQRNIKIINLSGNESFMKTIPATAELTWGLILCLTRNIPAAIEHTKNGYWQRDFFKGVDCAGKSIGIIGFGRIGKILSNYAHAFNMNVYAYDTNIKCCSSNVSFSPLSDVLKNSDIVTVHIPGTSDNDHYIDRSFFSMMKYNSYFINTSRGNVVNENDLLHYLENGHIRGAAIDVLTDEITTDKTWLETNQLIKYSRTHNNLLITPHIGGCTIDSMHATEYYVAQKFHHYLGDNN